MKKWIIAVALLFALFTAGAYFLIPGKIVVTRSIVANANHNGVYRSLTDISKWTAWWPGSSSISNDGDRMFESGAYKFKKVTQGYNTVWIAIEKDGKVDSSFIHLFSLSSDSVNIEWIATLDRVSNPFSKMSQYLKARELGKKMESIITTMQKYMSDPKNVYGIEIKKEKMQLDFMVSIKKPFDHYPTTEDIYSEMSQIRKYIEQVHATENDHPVLNISTRDSMRYELVVAIPVDKLVPDSGVFTQRRMLKNGNLLATEITGGKYAVDSALRQLATYAMDHKYLNVARPFQSFLTDRMKVTDTTLWRTRIGYPIL